MQDDIRNYEDRLRPAGILYVNVYPYRIDISGNLRFLLLRRRTDVPLPGVWQPVSGKIRAGERIADAFVRQVEVKTGQVPHTVLKLNTVNSYYDEYYDTVMLVPMAAAGLSDDKVVIDSSLHTDSIWLEASEARARVPWKNQQEAMVTIEEAVQQDGRSALCFPLTANAFSVPFTREGGG